MAIGFDSEADDITKEAPAFGYAKSASPSQPYNDQDPNSAVELNLKAAQAAAEFAEKEAAKDSGKAKAAKIARATANACQAADYAYKDINNGGVATDAAKARIAHVMFEVVKYWELTFDSEN